jgi:hypothetical protein
MGMIARKGFPLGWLADADAVDAPPGALLRADNMVLDEHNILSLRRGVAKVNAEAFADTDVHSLHTQYLNGSRFRMAGATNKVYANGTALSPTFAGSGDISFGTHMGQIFMARGATKKKYDGTTVRNWGIDMTGAAPSLTSGAGGLEDEIASFNLAESPAFIYQQTDGTGPQFGAGYDGDPDGALIVRAEPGSWISWVMRQNGSDTDLVNLGSGNTSDDDTIVGIWVFFPSVFDIQSVQLVFSTDDVFSGDSFQYVWIGQYSAVDPDPNGPVGNSERLNFTAGWNHLTARRGDFKRVGTTPGRGWETIRSVHAIAYGVEFTTAEVWYDHLTFTGSSSSALSGEYQWLYQYGRDDGTYVTQSAESAASASGPLHGTGANVIIPSDASRDSQVNRIYLYRTGGLLDDYYLVQTYSGAISTASIALTDSLSDQDALDLGIILETGNVGPPDDIIDIEGPYYDRLFALTATHLYPSKQLKPDMFNVGQVIRISGADEVCLWVKKAFNGLYIGTTKDIYRLDGTGAELPDDTVEFTLTPTNIDHPPRSAAVAQEGSLLVYFAADGWRAFTGAGSQLLVGGISKLYQFQARHGVSAVNKGTGRLRADIINGQLIAITPEGGSGEHSPVLHRYVFGTQRWYRHTYSFEFRSIFAEPDGAIVVGDNAGFVRELDSGTDDDGDPTIAAVIWTSRDDDGQPYSPKQAVGFSINADAGTLSYTVELYSNDDGTLLKSVSSQSDTIQPIAFDIKDIGTWRQLQLRITGQFRTLRFSGFVVPYLALPMGVKAMDTGPMDLGQQDIVWARRVQIKCRAGANLTVTPYFDDVEFDTVTISVDAGLTSIYEVPVGRGYFGRVPRLVISSASDFHPYWVEFMHRKTTEVSEKPNTRIALGLGGEAHA